MEFFAIVAIIFQLIVARCWQTFCIAFFLAGVLYANQFAPGPLTSNPFFWGGAFLWCAVWLIWFEQLPKRSSEQAAKKAEEANNPKNTKAEKYNRAAASSGANTGNKSKAAATESKKAANTPSAGTVATNGWRADAPAFELNSAQELSNLLELNGNYLASPKLDGIFARWIPNQGLFTKNGRRITCLAHIEQQLSQGNTAKHVIDGEIYSKDLAFELINGLVRCEQARPEHSKLSFNAFDLPEHSGGHSQRQAELNRIITSGNNSGVVNVVSAKLIAAGQAAERYQHFLNEGFEGLILRSTKDLTVYKHKPLNDAEAKLVGFTPAKNDKQPFNGLVLQMPSGQTFVISNLKKAQRALLWQQGANGQLITYSYQQLTAKGLPRFARFKALRHDMGAN